MKDVSIVGRDFQVQEEPIGFVSARDFIGAGAGAGAWVGGLFGLLLGAAFLVLPGIGPVVIAGPLSAALLGGLEGALAGAAFGALSGALIGYEEEVNLGLLENEAELLEEVNDALDRIERGTFGRCENCERDISRERVEALPYARYCMRCARQLQAGAG